jgi:hypothetical protein
MANYKVNKNLVSPARQLSQDVADLELQQRAGAHRGIPRFAPEDVRNAGLSRHFIIKIQVSGMRLPNCWEIDGYSGRSCCPESRGYKEMWRANSPLEKIEPEKIA